MSEFPPFTRPYLDLNTLIYFSHGTFNEGGNPAFVALLGRAHSMFGETGPLNLTPGGRGHPMMSLVLCRDLLFGMAVHLLDRKPRTSDIQLSCSTKCGDFILTEKYVGDS